MIATPPGFLVNLFTLGIARARWIAATNKVFGAGAGFWFAWLLQPFANWGLAGRFNAALQAAGSTHSVSPFWCFMLTGWPFFGAKARFKRATERLNDVWRAAGRPA